MEPSRFSSPAWWPNSCSTTVSRSTRRAVRLVRPTPGELAQFAREPAVATSPLGLPQRNAGLMH
ncbi:MAG: hypothetical protein ABFD16_21700 [Thermoguttaceae bacterium]